MWDKLVKGVKYEQKFSNSCRYFPGSPRNRILQASFYRVTSDNIIVSILRNVFGVKETVVYPFRKENLSLIVSKAKKSRISKESFLDQEFQYNDLHCGKKVVANNIGITDSINEVNLVQHLSKRNSLYEYFCAELFSHGVLCWRVRKPSLSICVMNNYNHENGNFQDKEFVHVKAETMCSTTIYNCSCKTFSSCVFFQSENLTNVNNCCHCRLLNQLMQMLDKPDFIPENSLLNKKKLMDSLIYLKSNVLKLTSKSGVERYSEVLVKLIIREYFYLVENTVESFCNDNDKVISFDSVLEDNLPREKWEDVFDVASGLWTFGINAPSKKTVSNDQFNEKFSNDIVKRQSATNGYCFMPSVDLDNCDCDQELFLAGWVSESVLSGYTEFYHKINMYTDREVIECDVFLRKCLSNTCISYWDGCEDSVFCLSKSTCAGYELGWEFVDFVLSKGTFSGFVNLYSNKYKRRSTSYLPFMSTQTFIDWFFAWASHMHIDFREKCHMCPENQF
nr:uncharacterized protein LOC124815053 [Hydra vulgaris]